MGQENSKLDEEGGSFGTGFEAVSLNGSASNAASTRTSGTGMATPPSEAPVSERVSPSYSLGGSGRSTVHKEEEHKPQQQRVWMRNHQSRVASPADVRKGVRRDSASGASGPATPPVAPHSATHRFSGSGSQSARYRVPSGNGTRGVPITDPLADAMTQLLGNGGEPPAPTPEQRMEENKRELVEKVNNFIQKTNTKDMAALQPQRLTPSKTAPSLHNVSEPQKKGWVAKMSANKADAISKVKERERYYEPLTQEKVGDEVQTSLGETYETFAGYQGAVHNIVQQGVSENLLSQFLFNEEQERQLTTYDKWQVVRHAAEQVLAVYANRSNARWLEKDTWTAPTILDANAVAASVYATAVDSAIGQGHIAMLFIDDGRMSELANEEASPLFATDLWQAIKELVPNKVPSGQRLERLSVAGRHLLHAAVSVEMWYGANALRQLKVVLAVDSEQEQFMISELLHWNFFGLHRSNVVIMPLPRFHGFAQDQRTGRLAHVKGSVRLMLGTGYTVFMLNSVAEAYTLGQDGCEPQVLTGSVLEWLRDNKANWLLSGLFSDIERLRPEAMFDVDFLAAAMYAGDRQGCNMAMEVVMGDHERDTRIHDSIVVGRGGEGAPPGNCTLRASAMRTVRSYEILRAQTTNPHGFYTATHRYAFKVSALQRLLSDASAFHADVRLSGFYAYATFDISDITTFREARCAAILGQGVKGPVLSEVVYGKQWLTAAADILAAQDKVNEFRKKAMSLVKCDTQLGARPVSARHVPDFKERKSGHCVVLVLAPDHARMSKAALKMARLFVHNIVDRLHIAMLMSDRDDKHKVRALLDELHDKELDYNGQLVKTTLVRNIDSKSAAVAYEYCQRVGANLLVVPSERLCAPSHDLGAAQSSMALQAVRLVQDMPVLVVKSNTVGKMLAGTIGSTVQPASSSSREAMSVMVHLDSTQMAPVVDHVTRHMLAATDVVYLAKTQAYERSGQLSMRARRMFVQARMAIVGGVRNEERAYTGSLVAELPKAVEAEVVDMLVMSAGSDVQLSKEQEEVVRTAKTSVLLMRHRSEAPSQPQSNNFVVSEQGIPAER